MRIPMTPSSALLASAWMIACVACEPAPASAPPTGAAATRVIRGPEGRMQGMVAPVVAGDDSRACVSFALRARRAPQAQRIRPEWVTIQLKDALGLRSISGTDLKTGPGVLGPWFVTDTKGQLEVNVMIADPGGASASAAFDLELRDDWRWSVTLIQSASNPEIGCFGCFGSLELTTSGDPDWSMWAVWGGNWISKPVVY